MTTRTNRKLYVHTVYVDRNRPVADQVANYLRGQWVKVNGMLARVVNVTNGRAVLWMHRDNMVAVW